MRRAILVGIWAALSMPALSCTTRSSAPPTSSVTRLDDAKDAGSDAEASVEAGPDSNAPAVTERTLPKLDIRFYTVARGALQLAPLENTMFVHDNLGMARLAGRDLRREAELYEIASGCSEWVTTLQGRWPDAAYMAKHESNQTDKSFPGALLYRWKGDRWVALHPNKQQYTRYTNLVPWGARGAIAGAIRREVFYRGYQLTIAEPRVTAPFAPTPPTTQGGECVGSLDGTTIAAAGDSLLVAGLLCPTNAPAVETFERGRRKGTLASLPRPASAVITLTAIHARAPDDVFVGGGQRATDGSPAAKPYMAHFDGTRWELQDVPIRGEITSIDAGRDGLWVTSGGKLWKLSAGSWAEAPLPEAFEARRVVISAPGDIWVQGSDALLRSIEPERVLDWTVGCYGSLTNAARATKSCDAVYLEVATAPDAAGADYAYPEVAALVKAEPTLWQNTHLFETATRGKLYMGAKVADYATGAKLEALVKKHLSGSKPRLLCASPPPMRDLHQLMLGTASHF